MREMKSCLVIALLVFAACNNNSSSTTATQDSTKLSADIVSNPHTAGGVDATAAAMKPVLQFKDTIHHFGTIHEEEVVNHEFTFTNTGKSPLVITSATGSCGCTVPEYPHDPIAPGQTGYIKVTFNSAGKSGHQFKTVMLHANTVRNVHMLYIESEVMKKK
jgi:hypothetical protein